MQGDSHPAKLALRARRERAIAQLTESFAGDQLAVEAFEARIDAAYACQTEAELDDLVADLRHPGLPDGEALVVARTELVEEGGVLAVPVASMQGSESRPGLRAVLSNIERCDRGVMPRATTVEATFGNIELDLRQAVFGPGVTEIQVKAIFGSIEIVVPADITVEVHGSGVFGNFAGATRVAADQGAPTLRIAGSAVFASVEVKALPLPSQRMGHPFRARLPLRGAVQDVHGRGHSADT